MCLALHQQQNLWENYINNKTRCVWHFFIRCIYLFKELKWKTRHNCWEIEWTNSPTSTRHGM